jgi:hypothetical protein
VGRKVREEELGGTDIGEEEVVTVAVREVGRVIVAAREENGVEVAVKDTGVFVAVRREDGAALDDREGGGGATVAVRAEDIDAAVVREVGKDTVDTNGEVEVAVALGEVASLNTVATKGEEVFTVVTKDDWAAVAVWAAAGLIGPVMGVVDEVMVSTRKEDRVTQAAPSEGVGILSAARDEDGVTVVVGELEGVGVTVAVIGAMAVMTRDEEQLLPAVTAEEDTVTTAERAGAMAAVG